MARTAPMISAGALLSGVAGTALCGAAVLSGTVPADGYSYANISQFRTTHIELSLDVDFDAKTLTGGVALELQRLDHGATQLLLDTKDLTILSVTELTSDIVGANAKQEPIWISRPFSLGKPDPILGSPLIVDLPASRQEKLVLKIEYVTMPEARGLHWTLPTVGNPHQALFLYTLSAPINARSWIPLQDAPQVRATYTAHIHAPDGMVALMAAKADTLVKHATERWFVMDRAVPPAAMTLVVGELKFKATGPRTGVYAEKSDLAAAAKEFGDGTAMLKSAEKLLGDYPWDRFDIALMPPNFPVADIGGPDLALVAPTLIAADRSQLAPLADALAYSWSGVLVSPAEWHDRWLGQAIAGYLAQRMVAPEAAAPLTDGVLATDLRDRAFDDIFNEVPRRKGALFFSWLGEKIGPARVAELLQSFLEKYAGQVVATSQFVDYLQEKVIDRNPGTLTRPMLLAWLYDTGLPADVVPPPPLAAADVTALTGADIKALAPQVRAWSGLHWATVLNAVPDNVGAARLAELDHALKLSASPNAATAASWFALTLRAGYSAALPSLQAYLMRNGELALVEPLYEQMMQSEAGTAAARRIFALARHGYHPFVERRLEEIIKP